MTVTNLCEEVGICPSKNEAVVMDLLFYLTGIVLPHNIKLMKYLSKSW